MDRLGRGFGWGGAPAPTDILCFTEKVPPSGVVFCPDHHPTHQGSVPPGGGGTRKFLPPIPLQEIHRRSLDVRYHLPVSQAGGDGDPKPDSVHLVELDGIICCHRTVIGSSPWTEIVKNRVLCHAPVGWLRGDTAPSCAVRTNGARGGHGGSPRMGCPSTETGNQGGGVAHPDAVQDERERDGVSGVA